MNPITLQNIAQALWMKDYDASKIPPDLLRRIESAANSEAAYADRFLLRLQQLEDHQLSFVQERTERYALLRQHLLQTKAMSPREFYASCLFLGPESNTGYAPVPLDPQFSFPQIDLPQLQYQLGWHFFVGNFTDAGGHHYSVELMFWQYALLPPLLAAELGLSDIENQSLEMHLAICDPQTGLQYRANTVVVAGTTGLVEVEAKPFAYRIGRNAIEGLDAGGSLFPVRLQARGWDMGKPVDVEFGIDISLDNPKGYFMQGDGGCSPSIDGLGTLYYSASLLKLRPGAANVITIDGKRIELTDGSMRASKRRVRMSQMLRSPLASKARACAPRPCSQSAAPACEPASSGEGCTTAGCSCWATASGSTTVSVVMSGRVAVLTPISGGRSLDSISCAGVITVSQ